EAREDREESERENDRRTDEPCGARRARGRRRHHAEHEPVAGCDRERGKQDDQDAGDRHEPLLSHAGRPASRGARATSTAPAIAAAAAAARSARASPPRAVPTPRSAMAAASASRATRLCAESIVARMRDPTRRFMY